MAAVRGIDWHPWKGVRHDPERIAAAVLAWRSGKRSLRSISKEMGISPATICRRATPERGRYVVACVRCGVDVTRTKLRPGRGVFCDDVCRHRAARERVS